MSEQLYNLAEAIDLCGKLKMLREMGCGIINIHEDSILLDEETFNKLFCKELCVRTECRDGGAIYTTSLGKIKIETVFLNEKRRSVPAPTDTEHGDVQKEGNLPDIIAQPDGEGKGDAA